MSYKLLRISTAYPAALSYAYNNWAAKSRPKGWSGLQDELFQLSFGDSNFCSQYLISEFEVEVCEIVLGWDGLYKEYFGVDHLDSLQKTKFLIDNIKSFNPDVILVEDISSITEGEIKLINEFNKGLKLLRNCVPLVPWLRSRLKCYDVIIACTPGYRDLYRENGLSSELIYHAYQPHDTPDKFQKSKYNFSFFGSLVVGSSMHSSRINLLNHLISNNIDIDIYCKRFNRIELIKLFTYSKLSYKNIIQFISYSKLFKDPLYGGSLYDEMSNYLLGFNSHIGASSLYAGNMRLFEATGIGQCLLTDYKSNLGVLFEDNVEVVTYRSVDEMIEKARWLSDNPASALEIGRKGMLKCLSSHTYRHRAIELNDLILKYLN